MNNKTGFTPLQGAGLALQRCVDRFCVLVLRTKRQVCKLQYLQYSYRIRRKLVQLTPVELRRFNWLSISTLIVSGESTITIDLFSEQFSLQRWSQNKKVIYRACWLQTLLVPFSFSLKFQVLLSSGPKNVPKSTLESKNVTRNNHTYEPVAI